MSTPVNDEHTRGEPQPARSLDPRIGGLLAYLVGWISGLVILATQTDREVRFHAAQSIIVFGGLHVFQILWATVVGLGLGPGFIGRTLFMLLTLVFYGLILALWGFLCVQGYTRAHFKVPGAGHLAEQLLERNGYEGRHAK